jgi:predicted AAA+ superfamily ATPase
MPTEETALGLRRIDLGMLSLAVFRGVLDDPVVSALARCVRLGEKIVEYEDDNPRLGRKYAEAYARFVSSLVEAEDGCLSSHVRNVVLDDENAYLRQLGAKGDVPAELASAAARELETLGMLANLTADELLAPVSEDDERELLPRFANEPVDLPAAYADRVQNIGRTGWGMYARYNVFRVERDQIVPVRYPDPQRLEDLVDYERQRQVILDNTRALLRGLPAANILLTGDAGTGKSSTVKAVANALAPEGLRILEVRKEQLRDIPAILDQLTRNPLKFVIFIDDLSFSTDDDNFAALKAILEGSVSAKSDNVVIYATSNRRHLVRERFSDRDGDEVHQNDTIQEVVSLSDRFGIHLTFYKPDKRVYLDIVHKLAADAGIQMDNAELDLAAERFATRRGGRSARGARQFVDSLVASANER